MRQSPIRTTRINYALNTNGIKRLFSILVLCFLTSFQSAAQLNYQTVDIELITISPGEFYWSTYGHTAIRIKNNQADIMYGFGYFDFEEENFFLNFAKGDMQYFLGVVDSEHELRVYQEEGRKITSQHLDLSNKQKQKLIDKLVFLSQPENRYYPYDYFLNNCTSQIRDLLDEVTNSELSKPLKQQLTKKSWSDLTFPASNQTWMNLGIAYIYGLPAFEKKTQWQLSVFPEVFSRDLKSVEAESNWNQNMEIIYAPTKQEASFIQYSFFQTHYAVILCVLVLLIGLLIKPTSNSTARFWLVSQSLLGAGLILLWFFTKHSIAMWNINLLIFSPLAFILLFKGFRKTFVLNVFFVSNFLWAVLALAFTNVYLIGFCLINFVVLRKLKLL